MTVGYEIFLFKLVFKLGDVVIWGARRLQELRMDLNFQKCLQVLLGRVVHFQGRLCRIFFGKLSLEVVPARLTPGFRVKFGVGRVSWYQSIRLFDSFLF